MFSRVFYSGFKYLFGVRCFFHMPIVIATFSNGCLLGRTILSQLAEQFYLKGFTPQLGSLQDPSSGVVLESLTKVDS